MKDPQKKKAVQRAKSEIVFTPEDVKATLSSENDDFPVCGRDDLEARVAKWVHEFSLENARPVTKFGQILQDPKRFAMLIQQEYELTRPRILFDKALREFIKSKERLSQFNKMSFGGIEFIRVDGRAENWARSQLSGRVLKGDGSIA